MNLNHNTNKQTGDLLTAVEWNKLAADVNELGAGGGTSSSTPAAIDTSGVVSVNSKGNTTISAAKHVNIEPAYVANGGEGTYGDVQIKPGDDITLESHHRATDKRDEITIKTSNGQDGNAKAPVKLQVIAADMTLSSKGKTGDDANVMNINVTTGQTKGYLKVRALAIDLRSETHGGIALQPKGEDSQHHQNKIKFEHGGGDGLEFGTFNTEKTSIFTDEYRFNREGVWKMATRTKEVSDKYDDSDETTHYKYVKAADDFYDNINPSDEQCTTKDIIKTAYALNGGKDRHAKITNKGAIEIATNPTYSITIEETPADPSTAVSIDTIAETPAEFSTVVGGDIFNEGDFNQLPTVDSVIYTNGTQYFSFAENPAPNINIESGGELKLKGILDFGSSFNFGETDNGVEFQYKLTKKNNSKDCGIVKVVGVNNHASNNLTVNDVTIEPGETGVIDLASMLDIISAGNAVGANSTCKISLDYRFDVEELDSLDGDPDYEYTSSQTTPFFEDGKIYTLDDFELAIYDGYISITLKVGMINIINGIGNDYRTAAITYDGTVHYYKFTLNEYREPSLEVKNWNSNNKVTFKDIVKFINWAKSNNEGPWAPQL